MAMRDAGMTCTQEGRPRRPREEEEGRPEGERKERLEKERWGLNTKVSRRERAVSDAPTTTTLQFTTICEEEDEFDPETQK